MVLKPAGCINVRGVTCEETTLGNGIKGFTLRPKVNYLIKRVVNKCYAYESMFLKFKHQWAGCRGRILHKNIRINEACKVKLLKEILGSPLTPSHS